jgi:hypothetical protein
MCRYAMKFYKTHWVCTTCCVSFKHQPDYSMDPTVAVLIGLDPEPMAPRRCPHCQRPMIDAGRDFKPPRKRDKSGWATVISLLAQGVRYSSCGCNGPGYRPRTKAALRRWDGGH